MKQIIGALVILTFFACENREPETVVDMNNLTENEIDSIINEFKFTYESPIVVNEGSQVIIPISTEAEHPRKGRGSSLNGYSYSKDYDYDYVKDWNVLFYNLKTGENNLLTEDKISIEDIYIKHDEYSEKKVLKGKILYEIKDIDFNNDGKLDYLDPGFLFVSELNGTQLSRISPQNESLMYFEVIPQTEQILIKTLRDVNQDSTFTGDDEYIWYKAELLDDKNNWSTEEIIDSSTRKNIERLYFEQWLKNRN